MTNWPDEVRRFLDAETWIFAKTYAKTWPHEYLVKDRVDRTLFENAVTHIRTHGKPESFYTRAVTYFHDSDGLVYWTMVPPEGSAGWYPVEEETIVNRCPEESTYEYRRAHGLLPEGRRDA